MARNFPNEESWLGIGKCSILSLECFVNRSTWNFDNKLRLLQADLISLTGDRDKAIEEYEASIELAKKHRFVHEQGLAFELLGSLYKHDGNAERNIGSCEGMLQKMGCSWNYKCAYS
jgi:hypothetical protein